MSDLPLQGLLPPGWEHDPRDPSAVICSRCLTAFGSHAATASAKWGPIAERIAAHERWHLEHDDPEEE